MTVIMSRENGSLVVILPLVMAGLGSTDLLIPNVLLSDLSTAYRPRLPMMGTAHESDLAD